MIGIMKGKKLVKAPLRAMEGESKVADAAHGTLLQKEVQQAVVQETLPESIHAGDIVQQIIIDVVGIVERQRPLVHGHTRLVRRFETTVVGEFGGDVIAVARVP